MFRHAKRVKFFGLLLFLNKILNNCKLFVSIWKFLKAHAPNHVVGFLKNLNFSTLFWIGLDFNLEMRENMFVLVAVF